MSKKTKQQKHQERLEQKEAHLEHVEQEAHMHDDDLVVAPKGMSRRKFIFTLAVTFFVVLAFVVPGAIMSSLGGSNPGDRTYVSWERPGVGVTSLSWTDFKAEQQSYNRLLSSIFRQRQGITDEETAAFLLENQLAAEAGVVISDTDLAKFLRDQLQFDSQQLLSYARSMNMTVKDFEGEMRRWLRVRRYRNLLTQGLQFPDTAEVESQWKDQFREYKFAYVEANSDAFDEEAKALVPDDTELETWFNGLQQFKKNNFMTKRKMAAEFAVINLDGTGVPAALLEKFPMDPETDPELVKKNYYDLVSSRRFQREAPEDEGEDAEPQDLTIPFEEVAEACATEAPVYYAMHEWLADMGPRVSVTPPEVPVDFAAEATELGLTLTGDETARSEEEWAELEDIYGGRLSGMIRYAPSGQFLPTVLIGGKTVIIARCTAVEDARMPEFAEIREQVVEAWVEEKRADVGLEALTAIYNGFKENPEDTPILGGVDVADDVFTAALTAAGFESTERDWRDNVQPPEGGFADAPPIEGYLRSNSALYVLSDGQVAEPSLDASREHIYMVRLLGSREPELVSMKPAFIGNIEGRITNQTMTAFGEQAFGFPAYAEKFKLKLHELEAAE